MKCRLDVLLLSLGPLIGSAAPGLPDQVTLPDATRTTDAADGYDCRLSDVAVDAQNCEGIEIYATGTVTVAEFNGVKSAWSRSD